MPKSTTPLTPMEIAYVKGFEDGFDVAMRHCTADLYAMKERFDRDVAQLRRQFANDLGRLKAIEMARLAERNQDHDPLH